MGRVSVDVEDAEAANVASVEADSAVVVVVGAGSLDNDEPVRYLWFEKKNLEIQM